MTAQQATAGSPYDVLGVSSSSSPDEVEAAYKVLAMRHHPDRNPGDPGAEARMRDINLAYAEISHGFGSRPLANLADVRPPASEPVPRYDFDPGSAATVAVRIGLSAGYAAFALAVSAYAWMSYEVLSAGITLP